MGLTTNTKLTPEEAQERADFLQAMRERHQTIGDLIWDYDQDLKLLCPHPIEKVVPTGTWGCGKYRCSICGTQLSSLAEGT